jgi:hypothetical protein
MRWWVWLIIVIVLVFGFFVIVGLLGGDGELTQEEVEEALISEELEEESLVNKSPLRFEWKSCEEISNGIILEFIYDKDYIYTIENNCRQSWNGGEISANYYCEGVRPRVKIDNCEFGCENARCVGSLGKVVLERTIGGALHRVYENGDVYKLVENEWIRQSNVYNPTFDDEYVINDGIKYLINPSDPSILAEVGTEFNDDFETGVTINDLVPNDGIRYTHFTVQSPNAKTDEETNAIRDCILEGSCDFIDNRIDVSDEEAYSGSKSLKFYSVEPLVDMITSKSSIDRRGLMNFVKGDELWFEAWYYIESGIPTTIVDFESNMIVENAGPRIILINNEIGYEMKFGDKPLYKQAQGTEVSFPKNKWTKLKVHLYLSEKEEEGIIEIWQDDIKIIDTNGWTLPTSNTILTNLEIGLTATGEDTTMYLDDVRISGKEF